MKPDLIKILMQKQMSILKQLETETNPEIIKKLNAEFDTINKDVHDRLDKAIEEKILNNKITKQKK